MNTINLTTPIYYANGQPHLGHAYTSLLGDVFKRYFELRGIRTRLGTGVDEHGLKIERAAQVQNKQPQEFVDELAPKFQDLWHLLGIDYDDFVRTSGPQHKRVVVDFWRRMQEKGDIYLGTYEGLYCVDCEQYYPEGDLLEGGFCPIHNKPVEKLSEESYFFRMSAYRQRLIDHISAHPDFIIPEIRRNEVMGLLTSNDLQDLSISRTSFRWGIPVPGDERHVIYVWVDALVNYISSLGGIGSEDYDRYWGSTIHLLGKDILKFHAVYWPCMLFSAEVPLPKHLLVHGWWTIQNRKISKSDPASRVDPCLLVSDIGSDGLRYFLVKGVGLGRDGDMSYENLIATLNADLANRMGNLLNRHVSMAQRYLQGHIVPCMPSTVEIDQEVEKQAHATARLVEEAMGRYTPAAAAEAVMDFATTLNNYLQETAPWVIAKEQASDARLQEIFNCLSEGLRWISILGYPFFPSLAVRMREQLGVEEALEWPTQFCFQERHVRPDDVLFKRISKDEEAALVHKWSGGFDS